jgi:hypothetical protein
MGQSPMFSNSFNEDSIEMTNKFIETSLMKYYDNNDDIYDSIEMTNTFIETSLMQYYDNNDDIYDSIEMTNTFIETSLMQYYDNNDDIYDHDGIQMNELLLVSRIIYPLLKKANLACEGGSSYGPSPPPHITPNSPIPNL